MPDEASALREQDDLDRIVASLKTHQVEFIIVGGFAVIYHGYVRNTKDLDVFIRRTEENAARTVAALEDAGFGFPELTPRVFLDGKGVLLGEPPMRVDIISDLAGVSFDDAWPRCSQDYYGDTMAAYLGYDDLICNKRAVGRPQDLNDVEMLEKSRAQGRPPTFD
jgi:hypothetical protein